MLKFRQYSNPVLMALIACFFLSQTIATAFASANPLSEEHLNESLAITVENSQTANATALESDSAEATEDDLEPELLVAILFPTVDCAQFCDASLTVNSWSRIRKQYPTRAPPQV